MLPRFSVVTTLFQSEFCQLLRREKSVTTFSRPFYLLISAKVLLIIHNLKHVNRSLLSYECFE